MYYSIKDYQKALQENIKTKLEKYHDRSGKWSYAKAEKEFNSRFKCLKYLPKFRKDAITKTQIKYAYIKDALYHCTTKSPCFKLACPKCVYYNNLFLVEELLEQFADCKKLHLVTILCPVKIEAGFLNHKNNNPITLRNEFLKVLEPVKHLITKGIFSTEVAWKPEKEKWILHFHLVASFEDLDAFAKHIRRSYNSNKRGFQAKTKKKRNRKRYSRVQLCSYICKFATYAKYGNKENRITRRPDNYLHNEHMQWLYEHNLESLLYPINLKLRRTYDWSLYDFRPVKHQK